MSSLQFVKLARAACAALGICAAGQVASGDTIINQRSMAASGSWDNAQSALIGGFGSGFQAPAAFIDIQLSDDFTVAAPTRLNSVTADFYTFKYNGGGVQPFVNPAEGFLVEIFPDIGGKPDETPHAWVQTQSYANMGTFTPSVPFGNFPTVQATGTISVDLSASDVVLPAGHWWISVTPVDTSPFGIAYGWIGTNTLGSTLRSHWRSGGNDHGNGYGGFGGSGDWAISSGNPANLSFSVEGVPIPAPAAASLLTMLGLAGFRRSRR